MNIKALLLSSLGAHIAQARCETGADGIEVMGSTLKPLKAALEAIRDMASNALTQIDQPHETRSMRWACKDGRYVEHFTKPVLLETAGRCPRCKSTAFNPILGEGCQCPRRFFPGTPAQGPVLEDFPLASRVRMTSQPDGRKPEPHFRRPE